MYFMRSILVLCTITVLLINYITPNAEHTSFIKASKTETEKNANQRYRSVYADIKTDSFITIKSINGKRTLDKIPAHIKLSFNTHNNLYPNFIRKPLSIPNDPLYNSTGTIITGEPDQWNLRQIDLLPTIDPNSAWNINTGSEETIIAVIDTGIDLTHPDIINYDKSTNIYYPSNIWVNQNEIPNSLKSILDTDNNDYVDTKEIITYYINNNLDLDNDSKITFKDVLIYSSTVGVNIIADNTDQDNNNIKDDIFGARMNYGNDNNDVNYLDNHGIGVAGIIGAAKSNNAIGISGICFSCKIMVINPFQVITGFGVGAYDIDIVRSIEYAINQGADIINLSLGGEGYSALFDQYIEDAWNQGILVVAAAGNSNMDVDRFSPASSDRVITVGASSFNKTKLSFSNHGNKLDIMAPGGNILSTSSTSMSSCIGSNTKYNCVWGTSIAAPHVSGVAGLIHSYSVSNGWNAKQIRKAILKSTEDLSSPGFDTQTGYGFLRAKAALEYNYIPDTTSPTLSITEPNDNEILSSNILIRGSVNDNDLYNVRVTILNMWNWPIYKQTRKGSVNNNIIFDINTITNYIPDGTYTIRIQAEDFDGNMSTEERNITIRKGAYIQITTPDGQITNNKRPTINWDVVNNPNPSYTKWYFEIEEIGSISNKFVVNDTNARSFTFPNDLEFINQETFISITSVVCFDNPSQCYDYEEDYHTISYTADTISPSQPNAELEINRNNIKLKNFTSSDNLAGIKEYIVTFNASNTAVLPGNEYNANNLNDGNYTISIKAKDNANNESVPKEITFEITALRDFRKTKADFNNDGIVNISDLSILAARWLQDNDVADANGDNRTNLSDLSILAANWQRRFDTLE